MRIDFSYTTCGQQNWEGAVGRSGRGLVAYFNRKNARVFHDIPRVIKRHGRTGGKKALLLRGKHLINVFIGIR